MSMARRMKIEMTRKERAKRRGPVTIEQQMEDLDLPQGDRDEVRKFQAYLADAKLPLAERIEKHGAEYLGFTPDEVAEIKGALK